MLCLRLKYRGYENLWKFVKAEVCAANYFQDAKTFQNSF